MEIKTTYEIIRYQSDCITERDNFPHVDKIAEAARNEDKEWVAANDILNELEDLLDLSNSPSESISYFIKKMIDELKNKLRNPEKLRNIKQK